MVWLLWSPQLISKLCIRKSVGEGESRNGSQPCQSLNLYFQASNVLPLLNTYSNSQSHSNPGAPEISILAYAAPTISYVRIEGMPKGGNATISYVRAHDARRLVTTDYTLKYQQIYINSNGAHKYRGLIEGEYGFGDIIWRWEVMRYEKQWTMLGTELDGGI